MQFKFLELKNFGPFLGQHKISFETEGSRCPIILIGGENGSGKTSLLEAVQLVLFGNLSIGPRRKNLSYENYLKKAINRSANPKDGAAIQITFIQLEEGKKVEYLIKRSWNNSGNKVTERLEVVVDQIYDKVLSEDWQNYVYHFVPPGISQLFFFDGEQIESLADSEKSSEIIKSAIQSLLGIDIVDQLETDLLVVENQEKKKNKGQDEQKRIIELEENLKNVLSQIRDSKLDLASLESKTKRLEKKFQDIEAKFTKEGGHLVEKRHEIEIEENSINEKIHFFEQQLINLSSGSLPLLLVEELLHQINSTALTEKKIKQNQALLEAVKEYNQNLTSFLQNLSQDSILLKKFKGFLNENECLIASQSSGEVIFDLPDNTMANIDRLIKNTLNSEELKAQEILGQIEELHHHLSRIEQQLASIPDNEAIRPIISERNKLINEMNELETQKKSVEKLIAEKQKEELKLNHHLAKVLKIRLDNDLTNQDSRRLIEHSMKVRETIKEFRKRAVKHHAKRLENLIFEKYQSLLHKGALVSKIEIDPETFSINLYSPENLAIDPERLSAGERQLLAIAILWGLATASGRKLPVIVDTPLGRLDTSHRLNIVKKYFPKAAEQVILLSTDEEIDKRYFDELRPWLGKKYIFQHSELNKMTSVKEGYFWKEEKPWQSKLFESQNMEEIS